MGDIDQATLWYQPNLDVFLNRWFSNYDDARSSLDADGGFLLPYRNHFFVCEDEAIRAMGLDPNDPAWERIGKDCVKPSDKQAYQRLHQRREMVVLKMLSDK
jgi:hypothetical protein